MLKYHSLISFCIGLVFLIVLQVFATPEPVFRFLIPAFLLYVVAVAFYNRWYLQKIDKYNFWIVLRSILLFFSAFGLFLVIPNIFLRGLFLVVTVGLIALFEILLSNFAENILLNETLLIAFGLFFGFFGFYQSVPKFETLYLILVFVATALLTRSFYELIPKPNPVKLVGSLVIGLLCCEFFWALNFLPLDFSITSLTLFNLFYFCLILNYYHLYHILNYKKVKFHLLIIIATSLLALLFTPWSVVA